MGEIERDTADRVGSEARSVAETTGVARTETDPWHWMRLVCLVKKRRSLAEDQTSRPLFEEHEIERWLRELAPSSRKPSVEQYRPAPVRVLRERPLTVLDPYAELLSQFEP
jgi:hypothetical protein